MIDAIHMENRLMIKAEHNKYNKLEIEFICYSYSTN